MIVSADYSILIQRDPVGEQRSIELADLFAGVVVLDQQHRVVAAYGNVIALPPWPDGSREFLVRTDLPPCDGGQADLASQHRRLVNAVHYELVRRGQLAAGLPDGSAAQRGPAPDRVALPFFLPEELLRLPSNAG